MQNIPGALSSFTRFIQLKSLTARTAESYIAWPRRLAEHHGLACPSLASEEQVLQFIHLWQQKGYESSTVNQCVCALRLFFRDHLKRRHWACWDDIRIKRNKPMPTVLTRQEVAQLLAATREERFQVIFALLYHCGLRLGEALRLQISHIDSQRGVLRIFEGKGRKHREVPISASMLQTLRTWWTRHRHPRLLFPGTGYGWKSAGLSLYDAMHRAKKPIGESTVQAAMAATVKSGGFIKKGICCHALRHSYATHMLEEQVPLHALQRYLGHASIEQTAAYLHYTTVSERHAQSALQQLFAQVVAPSMHQAPRTPKPKR